VALGLETLELARLHEESLRLQVGSAPSKAQTARAATFFAEVNLSIEESHGASGRFQEQLTRLEGTLAQRSEELAASNRQLVRGTARRKVLETSLKLKVEGHKKCLGESLALQRRLRRLTHAVLAAQENERKKLSHELQDEVAQMLLGINVRLHLLKREATGHSKAFDIGVANTKRLVERSIKSVRKVSRSIARE
jgi:signal transduction histidine kinase